MSDAMVIDSLEVETFSCIVVCTLQGKKGKEGRWVASAQCAVFRRPQEMYNLYTCTSTPTRSRLLMLLVCSTVTGAL